MEESQSDSQQIYQIITKLINGKSQTLNFQSPTIPISQIKSRLQTLTLIPIHYQLLYSNGKLLQNDAVFHHNATSPSLHLSIRLRGGKGGFGSLLRGAATKAGQKKTNNFDACRDMSGRRLRHVNAEKKMEEWLAEEKERKLERDAEEFLKKNAKAAKKKGGGDGSEKYVEKYRKDSEKCREDVEKSVRESLSGVFVKGKRKDVEVDDGLKSKKLKIWMGKRKVDDSDSDDMDEEDSDDEMDEENEKSAVTDNEKKSDSNKEQDGSLASVNGGKFEGESSVGCSSESASEEEKETVTEEQLESIKESKDEFTIDAAVIHEENLVKTLNDSVASKIEKSIEIELCDLEDKQCELISSSNRKEAGTTGVEAKSSVSKVVIDEEKVSTEIESSDVAKPLNFDEFNTAAEMEVLGMERLKIELQEKGLKCGGTLQERAARLFLLKTTPLEKLPKKLLAKK